MKIKASGRSALMVAAGIWLCFSGPLHATGDADREARSASSSADSVKSAGTPISLKRYSKHQSHRWKKQASLRPHRIQASALRPATKMSRTKIADADTLSNNGGMLTSIPASVANAKAQASDTDTASVTLTTISAQASSVLKTISGQQTTAVETQSQEPASNTQMVSADELNDLDRTLSEDKPAAAPRPALVMASAQTSSMAGIDESTWSQTSLIGKIFIAFGGLLTLASAARMFIT